MDCHRVGGRSGMGFYLGETEGLTVGFFFAQTEQEFVVKFLQDNANQKASFAFYVVRKV